MIRRRFFTLISPLIFVAMLQLSGCVRSQVPDPEPGGVYISSSGGAHFEQSVRLVNDQGEYIGNIDGYSLRSIHRSVNDANRLYLASGGGGLLASFDAGNTWRQVSQPLPNVTAVTELTNGVVLLAGSDEEGQGLVLRSLDSLRSWQEVLTIPANKQRPSRFYEVIKPPPPPPVYVASIALNPFDNDQVYASTSTGEIVIGSESGKVWRRITNVAGRRDPLTGATTSSIRYVIPSPHYPDKLLLITGNGGLMQYAEEELTTIELPNNATVLDAAFVPDHPNSFLVGTTKGALATADDGETWAALSVPLSSAAALRSITVSVSPSNPDRIIVTADSVIFRSEDGGKTWHTQSLDLPQHVVTDLSINPENAARVILTTTPIQT